MVKEDQLKKQMTTINQTSCNEIKELFAARFKAMDSKDVPSDLSVVSCTHDLGNDTMQLTVKTSDTNCRISDIIETSILNSTLVGGTGHEFTNTGLLQRVTLRNYPYSDRDVYEEILEKLTGVDLSAEKSKEASPPPSSKDSNILCGD
jgi:hypothetical protein